MSKVPLLRDYTGRTYTAEDALSLLGSKVCFIGDSMVQATVSQVCFNFSGCELSCTWWSERELRTQWVPLALCEQLAEE